MSSTAHHPRHRRERRHFPVPLPPSDNASRTRPRLHLRLAPTSHSTALCLLLATLPFSFTSLASQEEPLIDPSILFLLPPRGTLGFNQDIPGRLTRRDYLLPPDRRAAAWLIHIPTPDTFQVDLRSPDFDAYLYVLGSGLRSVFTPRTTDTYTLTDDDSGDGFNARVCFTAPRPGTYRVVASALFAGDGAYSIAVRPGCDNAVIAGTLFDDFGDRVAELPISNDRQLMLGEQVVGTLTSDDEFLNDRYLQAWSLSMERSHSLSITMESDDFDAYLLILSPQGDLFANDDAGILLSTNAQIELSADTGGTYRIFATSYNNGKTGDFRLSTLIIRPAPLEGL